MGRYEIRKAATAEETAAAMALRRRVFVEEQGLFASSDQDQHDRNAICINAWKGTELIGTVRCYPDPKDETIWWGSRLAVHEAYRAKGVGVYLIEAAVEEMRLKQVGRFLAQVQLQNVPLFEKLGWKPVSDVILLHGHPHQTMEANLHVRDASWLRRRQKVGT